MVMGDLIRFVSIYLVFVMGFAQSYFIIFLSFDNPATPEGIDDSETNPVPSAMESIVAMFLMSLTNFGDYYGTMERTNHEMEGKILFVIFMVIVAVLLGRFNVCYSSRWKLKSQSISNSEHVDRYDGKYVPENR